VYIPPLQSLNSTAQPASTSSNPGADLTSTFLQLLTAQLQSQSPLDPLDPNAFVAQLAQFNSLGELTQIESLMQTLVNNTTPASCPNSSGNASSSAVANSTSAPSLTSISH
jgi:flagellar basal-body rod modification protein FlgD